MPALAGGFEQDVGSVDVGLDEGAGVLDRAVDVGLGSEVDDRLTAGDRPGDGGRVGDVALDEVDGARRDGREVLGPARVGELVEDDDPVVGSLREMAADVGGADEPGPAGYEQFHPREPIRSKPASAKWGHRKQSTQAIWWHRVPQVLIEIAARSTGEGEGIRMTVPRTVSLGLAGMLALAALVLALAPAAATVAPKLTIEGNCDDYPPSSSLDMSNRGVAPIGAVYGNARDLRRRRHAPLHVRAVALHGRRERERVPQRPLRAALHLQGDGGLVRRHSGGNDEGQLHGSSRLADRRHRSTTSRVCRRAVSLDLDQRMGQR